MTSLRSQFINRDYIKNIVFLISNFFDIKEVHIKIRAILE